MQYHLPGSQFPSPQKGNFQTMTHHRQSQMTKLESKRENPNQCSAIGKARAMGKNTLVSHMSSVTYQRGLNLPMQVHCFLYHKSQKHRGSMPGLSSISCLHSFFLGASNKHCTSLHHNPLSVHWLYCARESRPQCGSVTISHQKHRVKSTNNQNMKNKKR